MVEARVATKAVDKAKAKTTMAPKVKAGTVVMVAKVKDKAATVAAKQKSEVIKRHECCGVCQGGAKHVFKYSIVAYVGCAAGGSARKCKE